MFRAQSTAAGRERAGQGETSGLSPSTPDDEVMREIGRLCYRTVWLEEWGDVVRAYRQPSATAPVLRAASSQAVGGMQSPQAAFSLEVLNASASVEAAGGGARA